MLEKMIEALLQILSFSYDNDIYFDFYPLETYFFFIILDFAFVISQPVSFQ